MGLDGHQADGSSPEFEKWWERFTSAEKSSARAAWRNAQDAPRKVWVVMYQGPGPRSLVGLYVSKAAAELILTLPGAAENYVITEYEVDE